MSSRLHVTSIIEHDCNKIYPLHNSESDAKLHQVVLSCVHLYLVSSMIEETNVFLCTHVFLSVNIDYHQGESMLIV